MLVGRGNKAGERGSIFVDGAVMSTSRGRIRYSEISIIKNLVFAFQILWP